MGARGDADQWPTAGGVGGLRRATRNKKNRNKKNRKKKGSSCRHKRDTKMVGASSGSPGARWPSHSKREREREQKKKSNKSESWPSSAAAADRWRCETTSSNTKGIL